MNLLWRPWRLYADFRGRSRRTEFILFFVCWYAAMFLAAFVAVMAESLIVGATTSEYGVAFWMVILVMIAGIVPTLALIVRRLHDQDKPGWFLLITLIPFIGALFWLLIAFWPGTKGENDYGWDPRQDRPEPTDRLEEIFS